MILPPSRARAVALALPLFALAACGKSSEADKTQAAGEPTAPSSEWVAPNPTEPAVPVDLPTVEMTNVPAQSPAASPAPRP